MFNKNVILFLKRDSLELYIADSEGPKNRLLFPPEILKYEEILDTAKFESTIASFLQKEIAPNQKVTVLLSPDILFQKTIALKDNNLEESETQKFAGEIPFDSAKTATIKVALEDKVTLIATNKRLYLPIVASVEKLASQVQAVIPASLFGISGTLPLAKNDISQIFGNSKLIHASNFLLSQPDTGLQTDQEGSKSFAKNNKKFLLVIFAVLIIAGGASFLFIKQNRQAVSPKNEAEITQVSPTPTSAEESTTAAEIEEISKEALKIQILNGTGVEGQAQDLADLLTSDGFSDIILGNSATADNTQTTAAFKDSISQTVKDNFVQKLEAIFETVEAETLQESDFDIEITTGKLKAP